VPLKVIPLLQAFFSAIFLIYGTLHGPSTSSELLVLSWSFIAGCTHSAS